MPAQPRFVAARIPFASAFLLSSLAVAGQAPAATHPTDSKTHEASQAQTTAQHGASPLRSPGGVALSPDGETVAWTLRGREGSSLHLAAVHPSAAGADRLVTVAGAPDCGYFSPVWSPDGQTLAFLADCAPLEGKQVKGQLQIYLWSKTAGQARQLTHLTGEIQQPAWSPDGKAIAFLFVENATRSAGALDAMKPFAGVIGEDGVEIQRTYGVDATSGQGRFLTPADLHVYEFDWNPNSQEIAFIAANPPGENNWWVAKLYSETVRPASDQPSSPQSSSSTGKLTKIVVDPGTVAGPLHGLQIAVPRFSPDGTKIAFIGGLMSDQGSTGGDLYVVPAKGGTPDNVTSKLDGTVAYEGWNGNDTLGFVEDRRGHTLLNTYTVATRSPVPGAPVDLGEVSVSGGQVKDAISVSDKGTFAMVKQGLSAPPEVWAGPAAHLEQVTHLNTGLEPATRTQSVEWTNGAFHVQGWLTFPAHYDPGKRYPIIVNVHGGPSASITARFPAGAGLSWADHGYFELQPNPRGSFGQGEAFTEANRKDFGYGDLKDIEAGLDYVESKFPIDHNREGITGWSYGGFMTMFSVTQTHRFKAAVAGAGLSDWLSYYGENSIDQWMLPFFGASVYDDPAVYARSSAITFIKHVTTPTLVIVGDRDGECPAPQSFEFWHALRDLGVKTQLVVYPDEGHGFRDPEHIRDRNKRMVKWFDQYLQTPGTQQASGTGSQPLGGQ